MKAKKVRRWLRSRKGREAMERAAREAALQRALIVERVRVRPEWMRIHVTI